VHHGEEATDIEGLKDELQNWLDGMPENLQGGSKAEEIQDCINSVESIIDYLDSAISAADSGVKFPTVRG
jgi:hypothetical protein